MLVHHWIVEGSPGTWPSATPSAWVRKRRRLLGSVGDSYDNALAELVFGLYKSELPEAPGAPPMTLRRPPWPGWTGGTTHRLLWPIGGVPSADTRPNGCKRTPVRRQEPPQASEMSDLVSLHRPSRGLSSRPEPSSQTSTKPGAIQAGILRTAGHLGRNLCR